MAQCAGACENASKNGDARERAILRARFADFSLGACGRFRYYVSSYAGEQPEVAAAG
jgi:hypothetical protein